jgi:dihydrofolate reductase
MRKVIAALVVSVDGFIEGPNGELDWVHTWEDPFDLLPQIDTCILGRRMYPGYEQYWGAILANPDGVLSFTGRVATKGEIAYVASRKERPMSFCRGRWTPSAGRTHGSFETSKMSDE